MYPITKNKVLFLLKCSENKIKVLEIKNITSISEIQWVVCITECVIDDKWRSGKLQEIFQNKIRWQIRKIKSIRDQANGILEVEGRAYRREKITKDIIQEKFSKLKRRHESLDLKNPLSED